MCLLGVWTFQPHFNPSQPQRSGFLPPNRVKKLKFVMYCMLSESSRCAFWGFQLFGVKIQLCPNLGLGVLRGQKRKSCPFFQQIDRKSEVV